MSDSVPSKAPAGKIVPKAWSTRPVPQSAGTAFAALEAAVKKLAGLPLTSFKERSRAFADWFKPARGLIEDFEFEHALRVAAAGRPDHQAFLDKVFPRAPQANGHAPDISDKPRQIQNVAKNEQSPVGHMRFHPFFAGEGITTKPAYLIKNTLRERGVVIVGGQSQSGKSYFAVDIALALSLGLDFFGNKTLRPVGVIYAAAEGDDTIQPRLIAAQKARGLPADAKPPVLILREFRLPKRGEGKSDTFAPYLDDLRSAQQLFVQRGAPRAEVIIIDTASAGIDMDSEQANEEIANVIERLKAVGKALDALVIVVHHFGKDAGRGLRGASAWFANADQAISVYTKVDGNGMPCNPRSIYLQKLRGVPPRLIANISLESVVIGKDADGEDEAEAVMRAAMKSESVTAANMSRDVSRKEGKGPKILREAFSELSHSAEKRAIERGGPQRKEVKCVRLELLRDAFYGRHPDGNEPAGRTAWSRAMKAIAEKGLGYEVETDSRGCKWIWRPDMQEEAQAREFFPDIPE